MMIKKICFLMTISTVFLLSGCASIVNGTNQKVSVITTPTSNASCELKNNKGSWHINKTPGIAVVKRSYKNLNVTCNKKGFTQATVDVESKTKAMAFGNLVFGGVIGAGIDVADGAAYDYPETITVPMSRKSNKKSA